MSKTLTLAEKVNLINSQGCYLRAILRIYTPVLTDLVSYYDTLVDAGCIAYDCWIRDPVRVTTILNPMFHRNVMFKGSFPIGIAPTIISSGAFDDYYVIVSYNDAHFELLSHNSDEWTNFKNFCSNPCNNLAVNGRVVSSVRIYYEAKNGV